MIERLILTEKAVTTVGRAGSIANITAAPAPTKPRITKTTSTVTIRKVVHMPTKNDPVYRRGVDCRCKSNITYFENTHIDNNSMFSTPSCDIAIVDSGCSKNFLCQDAPALDKDYSAPTIIAGTPNGATITFACSTLLPSSAIPDIAPKTHSFPSLTYRSLLAVCQFCDPGYCC